jgi:cobalt-zinc-cadmium efflux system protein
MMLVEVFGGWWSGSMELLAEAGHKAVDSFALLLAGVGAR